MEKATVLVAPKPGEIDVQQIELTPPGPNEVQIRAHRSLVSHGTERAYILHLPGLDWLKYPCYPGYASAGIIEAVGKDVKNFKVGDRVCSQMSHRSVGNLAEDRVLYHIPEGVSYDESTFFALAGVGLQGVRKARIEIGEAVAVFGLGVVGQMSVQCCRINGGLPVIGLDRVQSRMDLALKCGADMTIDTSKDGWMDKLKAATGGKGPSVVIEATGFPDVIAPALEVVAHFGRVILTGSPRGLSTVDFYKYVHGKQVSIIGAHANENPKLESRPGYWTRIEETLCTLQLLAHKRLKTDVLITERIKPADMLETYKKIITWQFGESMGTLIEWK